MTNKEIDITNTHPPVAYVKAIFLAIALSGAVLVVLTILFVLVVQKPSSLDSFSNDLLYDLLLEICICAGVTVLVVVVLFYRHASRPEYIPYGTDGGLVVRGLFRRQVQPMVPLAPYVARSDGKVPRLSLIPQVPSFFDLLEADDAPGLDTLDMVVGFVKEALTQGRLEQVRTGWPGTFAVAGKGRSGKSRRILDFIGQALLKGFDIIVCDPHYTKKDGLARMLEPLSDWITIARGEEEIVAASQDFLADMEARADNVNALRKPKLILYDEWSRLMNPNNGKMPEGGLEVLVQVFTGCSTQYAGYNGFAGIIGQVWTNEECGGTIIRRTVHAAFVHALSSEYAQFFLKGKWARMAEEIARRECLYRDADNHTHHLVSLDVPDDYAVRLSAYLFQYGINPKQRLLDGPHDELAQDITEPFSPYPADGFPEPMERLQPKPITLAATEPTQELLVGIKRTVFDAVWALSQGTGKASVRSVAERTGLQKDIVNGIMRDLADEKLITWERKSRKLSETV